jgi:hypothetical protein
MAVAVATFLVIDLVSVADVQAATAVRLDGRIKAQALA